ncbi:MAG: ComEA family DNA-binding protein [Oscillochloris sp.]|nr:ComEA family DNA-binding protein [Oscillochloris sp.]
MEDGHSWWRRPRVLAALACMLIGVAVLFGGPALRGAAAPAALASADESDLAGFDELPPPLTPSEAAVADDLIVYVSGAVAVPDVYRLPQGARVLDAVLAAGGMTSDAANDQVNLAAPLSDAQHIQIPRLGVAAGTAPLATESIGGPAPSGLLDLNRASASDLEELPGIGKALAARIIAYREQQGPFASVADLQNVTGIGDALFARISSLVCVNT